MHKKAPRMKTWYQIDDGKSYHRIQFDDGKFTVNGLANGYAYNLNLVAYNEVTCSDRSPTGEITPLRFASAKWIKGPTFNGVEGGNQSVNLWFEETEKYTEDVQAKYRVEVVDVNKHTLKTVECTGSPFCCEGLKNGCLYTFVLIGYNSSGDVRSYPRLMMPLFPPNMPKITNIKMSKDRELLVHFDCKDYKRQDIFAEMIIQADPPIAHLRPSEENPIRITQLTNGQTYKF
eukprot:UN33906